MNVIRQLLIFSKISPRVQEMDKNILFGLSGLETESK